MKHLRRARGCGCIFAAVSLARAPTTTRSSARPGGHPLLSPEAAALTKGQLEPGPRPRQPPAPGSTYRWCRETPKPRRPRSGPGGRLGRGRRPVSPAGTWRRCASGLEGDGRGLRQRQTKSWKTTAGNGGKEPPTQDWGEEERGQRIMP